MPRDPRSASTLIRELRTAVPDLDIERDDPDGLGVHRTFRLTSKGHKGLDDIVSVVADQRIVQTKSIGHGVEVTFSHLTIADSNDAFGVEQVTKDLLTRRAAKKAPAKKAAKKAPAKKKVATTS